MRSRLPYLIGTYLVLLPGVGGQVASSIQVPGTNDR